MKKRIVVITALLFLNMVAITLTTLEFYSVSDIIPDAKAKPSEIFGILRSEFLSSSRQLFVNDYRRIAKSLLNNSLNYRHIRTYERLEALVLTFEKVSPTEIPNRSLSELLWDEGIDTFVEYKYELLNYSKFIHFAIFFLIILSLVLLLILMYNLRKRKKSHN
jgi:hypothetical protein